MNISDIYYVSNAVGQFDGETKFQDKINLLSNAITQIRQAQGQPQLNPQQTAIRTNAFNSMLDILNQMQEAVNSFHTNEFNSEQLEVLSRMDFEKIVGKEGKSRLERFRRYVQQKAISITDDIQSYITDWNTFKNLANSLSNNLSQLKVNADIAILPATEGIIEIIFSDNVSFDDFEEGRMQMDDWFIIIHGYAMLLGVTQKDFEIVGFSKNSPTKIKVKTALGNTLTFVTIISSIIISYKTLIESESLIERLKKQPIIPEFSIQQEFIKKAEEEQQRKLEEKLEDIVESKLKEHNINVAKDGKGDVKLAMKKSIQKQYQFIVNGGEVRIQIGDGNHQDDIIALEKAKEELKVLKASLQDVKALNEQKENDAQSDTVNVQ